MELEQLKLFLRVSHSMEDSLISTLQEMAESEIKDSVYPDNGLRNEEYFKDSKIFEYAVFILTASYYENRFAYSDVQYVEVPHSVTGAIQKLRAGYEPL